MSDGFYHMKLTGPGSPKRGDLMQERNVTCAVPPGLDPSALARPVPELSENT